MHFDKDYFERGLQTGKSGYENYRWIPELTIPFAFDIIRYCEIKKEESILDFGCAKGFLVKAFRLLHYHAEGVDISRYAIKKAPEDIKRYLFLCGTDRIQDLPNYDWLIAKDVFEHITVPELVILLRKLQSKIGKMFVIVPLGKDGKFNASTNDLDPSHEICEDFQWWCDLFNRTGFKVTDLQNEVPYMKQAYKEIPNAHAFIKLKSE